MFIRYLRSACVAALAVTAGCGDIDGAPESTPVASATDSASVQIPADGEGLADDPAAAGEATSKARHTFPALWFRDCDADGYAASARGAIWARSAPAPTADCAAWTRRPPFSGAVDCEDTSAAHHPGADYGLVVTGGNAGLQILLCRPDGTYVGGTPGARCVVTQSPDLDCDGQAEPLPGGVPLYLGSHAIATLTHACADAADCDCWHGELACGIDEGVSASLCPDDPSGSPIFAVTGDVVSLCR